jgi:hypothetical protein
VVRWWLLPCALLACSQQKVAAPTADPGPDRSVEVGAKVQLDASRSSDPAGRQLAFAWEMTERPAGSFAEIDQPNGSSPRFVADQIGRFTVRLYANSDVALSAPAFVHVQASARDGGVLRDAGSLDATSSTADAGFTTFPMQDENGDTLTITQGPPGPPAIIGCSDGRREGLLDMALFPDVAACIGEWSGEQSLRQPSDRTACGNDAGKICAVPADLCAPGWHLCASGGSALELSTRLTPDQCDIAGGGRYVAATSHCQGLCVTSTCTAFCQYDPSGTEMLPCLPNGNCSEPACCGQACRNSGSCTDGVWPSRTHITNGPDQGCGMVSSRRAGGVLCCR